MICIAWEQLPVYAARSIGAFVDSCKEDVVVIRVPTSRFPIQGAAEMTHTRVIDVAHNDPRSISEILVKVPDVFVCGGWGEKSFRRWLGEVKGRGGRTIVCTDEPYRGCGLKQILRRLRFKLFLRHHIDYMFVAGGGGVRQFVGFYGLPPQMVRTGLYAGDPELFFNGPLLFERPKRFTYVGHYDDNKNVIPMCKAFALACKTLGEISSGWELAVYGGGTLENELKKVAEDLNLNLASVPFYPKPHITVNGFVNADQLGPIYRDSRCFVLGSHSEQWGVVVHEASMSGCMLLLSSHVGSRFDFSRSENAIEFDPDSIEDFARGFKAMISKSEGEMTIAQEVSLSCGRQFSPTVFADSLNQMIAESSAK